MDWQKKESARAGMRKMIKRLLKKYKYPPEEAANALETVIRQCEQWTDNDDSEPLYQKAPKKYEFPESSSYTIAAEPNIKYNNLLLKNKSHISIIMGTYRLRYRIIGYGRLWEK
nr:type I restriction enzyme endonuclease domain-containing protein [Bacteroides sp. M10]